MSSSTSPLTDEQRARIAANKAKAIQLRKESEERRRLAEQQQKQSADNTTRTTTPSISVPTRGAPLSIHPGTSLSRGYEKLIAATNASNIPVQKSPNKAPSAAASEISNAQFPSTTNAYKPTVAVNFLLVSTDRFKVLFKPFHMEIVNKLKTVDSRHFDPVEKSWSFELVDYEQVKQKLAQLKGTINLEVSEIPRGVRRLFHDSIAPRTVPVAPPVDMSKIEPTLYDHLFSFQKHGVKYGIEKNGRLLLADDMGLGKSIQALAIASYYQTEWPLLIVCPSSVKYVWKSQIETFLSKLNCNVHVMTKRTDPLPTSRNTSVVVIMSYDLMVSRETELKLQSFYVTIFDESHMLKDAKAKRTRVATELSKKAHRVLLLSGTPALSRPVELYSQVRMIDEKIFPSYYEFAKRYCDGKAGRFGFEAKGKSNPEELSVLLDKIMIRRLKKDVLDDLPEKRREIVYLSGDKLDDRMATLRKARAACENFDPSKEMRTKRETFMEYFVQTGQAKMPLVAEYVVETYFYDGAEPKKIIIFAHHQAVLDTIGMQLKKNKVIYIRIDGHTPSKERDVLCQQFQNDPETHVAVLSITAAGTGITLTAASVVLFAELYWNPSTMMQAEDRAHRVGQRDSVLVQYILARKTADMDIWAMIGEKLKVLSEVNLSDDNYRDAGNSEKMCNSNKLITEFFKEIEEEEIWEPFVDEGKPEKPDDQVPVGSNSPWSKPSPPKKFKPDIEQ